MKVQRARLQKITEAGTLRVTKLNAADYVLRDAGKITIKSVLTSDSTFAYILSPVKAEPIKLWTREHEVMIEVVRPNVGICRDCDEPVSLGRFAWDHRISTGPGYQGEWRLGEDSFTMTRHTSGKEPCGKIWHEDTPKAQCPLCGAYESLKTVQHAYSDETTCTTDGCTYRSEYRIGD